MEFRRICDDTDDMGMFELAHNQGFVKDGEAWYRNFERQLPARDLVREVHKLLATEENSDFTADDLDDNENFDDLLLEAGAYGTENLDGVLAILYNLLWGMADVREWLKAYETHGLPTTMRPEVLKQAIDTWGGFAQTDMAIEEMSELTKAILKHRRAKTREDFLRTRNDVYEEMADVIIMLMQLLMIFGGRQEVQKIIDEKINRLAGRLENAGSAAADGAAQEVMQPAT